ncbi:MAG: 2-oxoacid:acceptor oxidoreductase family protein [Candidatus Geothermincolia bacterium]
MVEIRFHSVGGQGAVTLIRMLALAGDKVGLEVQAFPFFGAERRGAPVKSFARFDSESIDLHSQIYQPDFLVVMQSTLMDLALSEGLKKDTVILVNERREEAVAKYGHIQQPVLCVDATSIALDLELEVEGMPLVNIPTFGAISFATEVVPLETVVEVIRESTAPRHLEKSVEAARRGFTAVVPLNGKRAGKKTGSKR